MSPGVGVKGTDAHEPVHAAFALQIAEGIIADDAQSGTADPGLFIAELVDQLGLKTMALGPARIKPKEHLRPVTCFGAAGAGLNLEKGIAGVLRAAEHRLQLEFIQPMLHAPQFVVQLGVQAGVFLSQFAQGLEIAARGLQVLKRLEQRVQLLELLNGLLGLVGIIPKTRPAHEIVQAGALPLFAGDVKDCPAAESDGQSPNPDGGKDQRS